MPKSENHGTSPDQVRETRNRHAVVARAEKADERRRRPRLAFRDPDLDVYLGDVREVLPGIETSSVDAVVTSPPYWRQRAYLPTGDPDGARELGREETFDEWVANLVAVARELRRILRPDGSLWLNLGDRYCASGGENRERASAGYTTGRREVPEDRAGLRGFPAGVKRKSLLLAPYRLAIALVEDGWILRDRIVWEKPNALPESARDRLAVRDEVLFRFTLTRYDAFDLDPIRVPAKPSSLERSKRASGGQPKLGRVGDLEERRGSVVDQAAGVFRYTGRNQQRERVNPGNVWSIPTASREGAGYHHFAIFPEELVVRPILSTVREGGTVLDPFAGTGTVAAVANRLGRRAILVELDRRRLDDIIDRTVRRLDFELLGLASAAADQAPGLFDEEAVG